MADQSSIININIDNETQERCLLVASVQTIHATYGKDGIHVMPLYQRSVRLSPLAILLILSQSWGLDAAS